METELLRVWQLVSELSDQLAHNHELASSLKNQAVVLKVDQLHISFYPSRTPPTESSRTRGFKFFSPTI